MKCKNVYEDCDTRASAGQCLTDAFDMRHFCPVSCVVEPCGFQGTVRKTHQGHATRDGTAQYRNYFEGSGGGGDSQAAVRQRRAWNSQQGGEQTGAAAVSTPPGHFREVFTDEPNATLALSSLGLGTYLGEGERAALRGGPARLWRLLWLRRPLLRPPLLPGCAGGCCNPTPCCTAAPKPPACRLGAQQ